MPMNGRRQEVWATKLRRKKALEAALKKAAEAPGLKGFWRRAWLRHRIDTLEGELRQGEFGL